MVALKDKRTNDRTMLQTLKNNAAAGCKGPVKIELLKGAGLLMFHVTSEFTTIDMSDFQ